MIGKIHYNILNKIYDSFQCDLDNHYIINQIEETLDKYIDNKTWLSIYYQRENVLL